MLFVFVALWWFRVKIAQWIRRRDRYLNSYVQLYYYYIVYHNVFESPPINRGEFEDFLYAEIIGIRSVDALSTRETELLNVFFFFFYWQTKKREMITIIIKRRYRHYCSKKSLLFERDTNRVSIVKCLNVNAECIERPPARRVRGRVYNKYRCSRKFLFLTSSLRRVIYLHLCRVY